MQGAPFYYMRPTSVFFLLLTSAAIFASYFSTPNTLDVKLISLYTEYWHLLVKLFLVTLFYLTYSFAVENPQKQSLLYHHLIATACMAGIVWEGVKIIHFIFNMV